MCVVFLLCTQISFGSLSQKEEFFCPHLYLRRLQILEVISTCQLKYARITGCFLTHCCTSHVCWQVALKSSGAAHFIAYGLNWVLC